MSVGGQMYQIEKTKDYGIFKTLTGNRDLEKNHVSRLSESIIKDNQLCLHPIIVNDEFYVVDGQHRLEVAKKLNLEIYFIRSNKVTDEHLILSNVNQKKWDIKNYINLFALKNKNENYIKIKQLMNSLDLNIKPLFTLLLGKINNMTLDFLKLGTFQFPQNVSFENICDHYQDFIEYITDKKITPKSMFKNVKFMQAFRWLYLTTGYDPAIFLKKLDQKWFDLKPQPSSSDWYKLLLEIYNFRNQNKLETEYE